MDEQMETIIMDRYTQLTSNFPAIMAPRWHDNTLLIRADVGIHNKIVCIYRRWDGSRMFPEPLYVSKLTAMKYKPFKQAKRGGGTITLRAIPVNEFKILRISERSLYAD